MRAFLSEKLIKIDISFIPVDKLPMEIIQLAKKEIISHKNNDHQIFEIANKDIPLAWNIIFQLEKYADKLFKEQDFVLACKIYRYLIETYCFSLTGQENLLKIYIKENNLEGIKWVDEKINDDIIETRKRSVYNDKNWALKVKYAKYLGGFEKVLSEMENALTLASNREQTDILKCMSDLYFYNHQKSNGIVTGIKSAYSYLAWSNTSPYENPEEKFSTSSIEYHTEKILKKAKIKDKHDELFKIIKDCLNQYPRADFNALTKQVNENIIIEY